MTGTERSAGMERRETAAAPAISVIVPTTGRSTLGRTLAALRRQTRPADEVIVVRDDEGRGPAWARNEGLRRARGDRIAFTDDDVVPPRDWIARLAGAIERHGAAGAGGGYRERDPLLKGVRSRKPVPRTERPDPGGLVGLGGNVMYSREWLDRCALAPGRVFDERYATHGGEDWDLVLRLRLAGARLVFVPVHGVHLRRVGRWSYLLHQLNRGIGIAELYRRQRRTDASIAPQKSLLWGEADRAAAPRWLRAAWANLAGPFDTRGFDAGEFLSYRLGTKAEVAGFAWGLLRRSRGGPASRAPSPEETTTAAERSPATRAEEETVVAGSTLDG